MLRDSIDYKGTAVGKLFRRFLFPFSAKKLTPRGESSIMKEKRRSL